MAAGQWGSARWICSGQARPKLERRLLFSLYAAICRTFWEGIWSGRFTGLFRIRPFGSGSESRSGVCWFGACIGIQLSGSERAQDDLSAQSSECDRISRKPLVPIRRTAAKHKFFSLWTCHLCSFYGHRIVQQLPGEPLDALCRLGMAGLVGFERIWNGVHHPSDVIAGFMLGYVLGKLAVKPWKIDASCPRARASPWLWIGEFSFGSGMPS